MTVLSSIISALVDLGVMFNVIRSDGIIREVVMKSLLCPYYSSYAMRTGCRETVIRLTIQVQ